MNDLISRQAAIGIIDNEIKMYYSQFPYDSHPARSGLDIAKLLIENYVPSAQPDYDLSGYSDRLWKAAYERGKAEAQRTGRWIYVEEEYCWCCSSCKTMMAEFETKPVWNYCPNCGCAMKGEE